MSYLIIFNPKSKSGKNAHRKKEIEDYFNKNKLSYEIRETKSLEDAYSFSREANYRKIKNIVAVGGDGTINQVINGFYDEEGRRVSDSTFGVIYTGTSPDFCKSYNIPIKFKKALNNLFCGELKKIEIGRIKYKDNQGKEKISYFGCCANIGLGADLAEKANGGIRKYFGDLIGTFISLIRVLTVYRGTDIVINNKEILKKVYNFSVGITPLIASGIKIRNAKDKGDGQFYMLSISKVKLGNVLKIIKSIYSGKEIKTSKEIAIEYGEKFVIEPLAGKTKVEFDGDPQGYLPCSISMALEKLDIIIPKRSCDGE